MNGSQADAHAHTPSSSAPDAAVQRDLAAPDAAVQRDLAAPDAAVQRDLAAPDAASLLAGRGASEGLLRHAAEMAQLMQRWQAGPLLVNASLFHEAFAQGMVSLPEVAHSAGAGVAHLCLLYRDRIATPPPAAWRGRPEALKRVRLYAAAYADPSLALLCVAHMWQALLLTEGEGGPPFTSLLAPQRGEVQSVLLPILEMLGLRELRDEAERSAGAKRSENPLRPSADDHRNFFAYLDEVIAPLLDGARLIPRASPFVLGDFAPPAAEREPAQQQAFYAELLVPSAAECYRLLQRLHGRPNLLRPIDGGVIDTVASCRPNGHRSLQTALVASPRGVGVRLVVQIVTPGMRHVNRWGVAAWRFDGLRAELESFAAAAAAADQGAAFDAAYAEAWWQAHSTEAARIDAAPPGYLTATTASMTSPEDPRPAEPRAEPRKIIVFSPVGEPFAFDPGSTVVDYAYSVHSDLAEQCRRFYVNGESVEPATVLRHMDLVELEHSPRAAGPTEAWLNAARTKKARTRIRRYLRRQTQGINEGQQIVDARLRALEEHYGFHVPDHRVEEAIARAARHLKLPSTQALLAEIAAGRVHADRYLHGLFAGEIVRRLDMPRAMRLRPDRIALAQCCRPRPGDDVVGLPYTRDSIVTRVTVHKAACPAFLALTESARVVAVPLRWRLRAAHKIAVHLDLSARDDHGLLGDALVVIYNCSARVTLFRTDAAARRGIARLRFSLEADCQETVDELADSLRRLPGHEVSSVRQLALSPSEQEALHADATGAANPYSRTPVHDPTMFFGRTKELEEIAQAVDHNAAAILLRGQKRIGKTSLLLHLRNHDWEPHVATCAFVDLQAVAALANANVFYEIASAVHLDLEHDPRVAALGAPVRAAFGEHAPRRLADYLNAVRKRLGTRRLVVLIDEFSRTTDLYSAGELPGGFFAQWRSLLQVAGITTTFITVVQQKSFEQATDTTRTDMKTPLWHALEYSSEIALKPLDMNDAPRRLIEWPIRNFVEYAPGAAEAVLRLTGGSPFVIQAFCNRLVAYMTAQAARTATAEDVDAVAELFMQPTESLFAHLLDLAPGPADRLITQMAHLIEESTTAAASAATSHATQDPRLLAWPQICAAAPDISPVALRRIVDTLCANDILTEAAPDQWRFTSTLFCRWLARNG